MRTTRSHSQDPLVLFAHKLSDAHRDICSTALLFISLSLVIMGPLRHVLYCCATTKLRLVFLGLRWFWRGLAAKRLMCCPSITWVLFVVGIFHSR